MSMAQKIMSKDFLERLGPKLLPIFLDILEYIWNWWPLNANILFIDKK